MVYCKNIFDPNTREWYMFEAYREARYAYNKGECPIGAVIVRDGEIVARAHNCKEVRKNALEHAEVIAIRKAASKLGDWRLSDCDMYVTLEPCTMCAGALVLSRIKNLYIGARDPKAGAVISVFNVLDEVKLNHHVNYCVGILEEECSNILKDFFRKLRKRQ